MKPSTNAAASEIRKPPENTGTSGFYSQIFCEIQLGKVPLPSLPHLVLQLRSAVKDSRSGNADISRIIRTDPGVASYLLKLANSPAFASRHKVTDLGSAINRLGMGSLVNLVTTYCLRQMFQSRSPVLRDRLRAVWIRSAKLGATCAVIAREITRHNVDRALLAGLLANVGALPLIRAVASREDAPIEALAVDEVLDHYSALVGTMMLSKWGFDDWLIETVRNYRQWDFVSDEKRSFAELVIVSDLLLKKNEESEFSEPTMHSVAAVQKFRRRWPTTVWSPELITELEEELRKTVADVSG